MCALCGSVWLTPTARGPHVRTGGTTGGAVLGRGWPISKEIQVLEAELDRALERLEP